MTPDQIARVEADRIVSCNFCGSEGPIESMGLHPDDGSTLCIDKDACVQRAGMTGDPA